MEWTKRLATPLRTSEGASWYCVRVPVRVVLNPEEEGVDHCGREAPEEEDESKIWPWPTSSGRKPPRGEGWRGPSPGRLSDTWAMEGWKERSGAGWFSKGGWARG